MKRSPGVIIVTGPMFSTAAVSLSPLPSTCFLLLLHLYEVPVQAGEFLLPEAAKWLDSVGNILEREATIVRGRLCASRLRVTRPARSSTLRCLEIVGWRKSNGFMSSETSASPEARRLRMARRVGSASAAKTKLKRSVCISIATWLYFHMAIYWLRDFQRFFDPTISRSRSHFEKMQ